MPIYLKQSTASQEVALGPFVDDTDGKTAETALTISNTDIKLHKAGATTLANKNSGGATHISDGIYYAVFDSTDTDTLGSLVIFVPMSGALPIRVECVVLAANIYDALIGGGDVLQVDVTQFNGTNGTFASGRPEVNLSHIAGSAVSTTTAQLGVNVVQVSGDSVAADNLEAAADGTGYNLGGGSIVAASVTGAVGSVTGAVGSVTGNVGGNVTGSVGSVATGGITAASIATGAIDADSLAADAVAEIADGVWDEDATGHQTQGTFGQAIGDPGADSDTIWGLVNTNLNATVSSRASQTSVDTIDGIVDAILVDTAEIGTAGAGLTEAGGTGDHLTAVPWNAGWDAEVQSEVQDAIEANHLDHLLAVTYDPASKPGAADALLNELVESDAGVARFTANALEQAPSGTGASASAIADAVWDEVLADHLTSGTTGAGLNAAGSAGDPWATALPGAYGSGTAGKIIGDNINATISSRLASASYTAPLDAAGVRTAVGLASANLDTQLAAIDDAIDTEVAAIKAKTDNLPADPADASDIASSFSTVNSTLSTIAGYLDTEVAAIKAKTDNLPASPAASGDIPSAATIADAVWDEARSGHVSAGSFGEGVASVQGNVTGNVAGSVASVSGAVGSVTGNVGGNVAGSVASVSGAVGSVTGNVGGNVTGSVGSLATQAKADVNAEVLDVINIDTFAEPGQEAPGATVSLAKKIGYVYKLARNRKTQDATTFKLYADDASTVDQKATVSDDGTTTTVGELGTGP